MCATPCALLVHRHPTLDLYRYRGALSRRVVEEGGVSAWAGLPLCQLLGTRGPEGSDAITRRCRHPPLVRRPCPNRESPSSPSAISLHQEMAEGGEPTLIPEGEREANGNRRSFTQHPPPPPPLFCAFGRESNRRSGVRARGRKCRHKKGEGKEKNNSNPRFRHRERERGCRGVRGESAAGMTGQRGGTCP